MSLLVDNAAGAIKIGTCVRPIQVSHPTKSQARSEELMNRSFEYVKRRIAKGKNTHSPRVHRMCVFPSTNSRTHASQQAAVARPVIVSSRIAHIPRMRRAQADSDRTAL